MEPTTCPDSESAWARRAWILITAILVLRLLYLALSGAVLDLSPDEAQYWDWSRRPDWGYFSKPPLIAWLVGASTVLGGDREFFVRLPAALASVGFLAGLFALTRRAFGARAGFWATALAAAAPASAVSGLAMTTDPLLLLFWTLTLVCIWRAIGEQDPARAWHWWLAAGAANALAVLSKQMGLVLPLMTAAYLALEPSARRQWRQPGFWVYTGAALLGAVPPLIWNLRHDWVTFAHTATHFATDARPSWDRHLAWLGEFVGSQAGLYSPIIYTLVLGAAVWTAWRWRRASEAERFMAVYAAPPLLVITLLALRQRIIPNWPAAFYVSAFSLAGAALAGCGTLARFKPGLLRWRHPAWALGAGLTALVLALPFVLAPEIRLPATGISPVTTHRREPESPAARQAYWAADGWLAKNTRGWSELATLVDRLRTERGRGRKPRVLVAGRRQPLGPLAFYLPDHPRVYRWGGGGHPESQYDVWPGPEEVPGQDLLILSDAETLPAELASCFLETQPLGIVEVPLGGARRHRYSAYFGRVLKCWPPSPAP